MGLRSKVLSLSFWTFASVLGIVLAQMLYGRLAHCMKNARFRHYWPVPTLQFTYLETFRGGNQFPKIGGPIYALKYENYHYWDPRDFTPHFGKPYAYKPLHKHSFHFFFPVTFSFDSPLLGDNIPDS